MSKESIAEWLDDAKNYVCECGQVCDPMSAEWRWNGRQWEHHHDYPLGHIPAFKRVPQEPE